MPEGSAEFKDKAKKALDNIARLAATFAARQEKMDQQAAEKLKADQSKK